MSRIIRCGQRPEKQCHGARFGGGYSANQDIHRWRARFRQRHAQESSRLDRQWGTTIGVEAIQPAADGADVATHA